MNRPRLPSAVVLAVERCGMRPTRFLLVVSISHQTLTVYERPARGIAPARFPHYQWRQRLRVSTSRFGPGQRIDSNQTPVGLHRVARKIGGGFPAGTVFQSRRPMGFVGVGQPHADILHRILWLEGLEPGLNRGGDVDTFQRYIYLHGFGDESSLGRPRSRGCIHVAAADLLPLYDRVPVGTLVWITGAASGRLGDAEMGRER